MRELKLGVSLCSLVEGRRNFNEKPSEFMAGREVSLLETRLELGRGEGSGNGEFSAYFFAAGTRVCP